VVQHFDYAAIVEARGGTGGGMQGWRDGDFYEVSFVWICQPMLIYANYAK
jgi:hypothetical protein